MIHKMIYVINLIWIRIMLDSTNKMMQETCMNHIFERKQSLLYF